MKKYYLASIIICFAVIFPVNAQVGSFLKSVKDNVSKEFKTSHQQTGNQKDRGPEPACACDDAVIMVDLNKFDIDYNEVTLTMSADGRLLILNRITRKYYIAKDGVITGPIAEGDSRLHDFGVVSDDTDEKDAFILKYGKYIKKSGEKYLITFNGKSYGPYGLINEFIVTKSGDKFAALVTENIAVSESQGKSMEEKMKNAKSDEERMALAMEMASQMQENLMQSGGEGVTPELVSNIPGAGFDPLSNMGASLNGELKYDDILLLGHDKIMNLNGKQILRFDPNKCQGGDMFVSSDNTKYACYLYGALNISDGKTFTEIFNPYLTKVNGQVYLAYMYYSPKRNAIMVCKIPF